MADKVGDVVVTGDVVGEVVEEVVGAGEVDGVVVDEMDPGVV